MTRSNDGTIDIWVFLVGLFVFPAIAMFLWNGLMPDLFGLPTLAYWQAFLLRLTLVFLTH